MSANEMKMYKGLDVLLSQYENNGDPHRLNVVYDEKNDKSVTYMNFALLLIAKSLSFRKKVLQKDRMKFLRRFLRP